MLLDDLDAGRCIPFIIGDGPSLSGPRIGGMPPEGVFARRSQEAFYLLTLVLEEDGATELSIFLHPEWWDVVFNHSRTLYSQDKAWVELVVHGPSVRSQQSRNEPLLTPHPLLFGPAELDQQAGDSDDEPGSPLWEHKLGGHPYFVRYKPQLAGALQEVEQQGYRQLLQLTFPGPKDAGIAGDWPFGGGNFYLFFSLDGEQYHWYYGWLY